jgi:AraC-like DNA-binding protein
VSWPLLFFAIDVANAVCAALLGARILLNFPRQRTAQLIALITVAAICHVVLGRDDYGAFIAPAFRIDVGSARPVLNLVRNMAPGLFMIVVHDLFRDEGRVPRWLLGLFGLQLFLEVPAHWLLPASWERGALLTQIVPTLLQTLFAAAALYWTIEDWRTDLVEARRRTRALVVVILAINVVASSVLLRVAIPSGSLANYHAHLALSVANLTVIVFLLVRLMGSDIAPYLNAERRTEKPADRRGAGPDPRTAAALARLTALIETDHITREPGLTLESLADRVGLPAYRLRRLIHEELGYRNFNAFLHHYRVAEACAQLRDPEMRRVPVLTIALSVGYQSINTFNRGFRDVTGVTPSAYRTGDGGENPSPKTA